MTRPEKIRCDACPVMCYIAEGKAGACDRYANEAGRIIRCDPLTILDNRIAKGDEIKPFLKADWDGQGDSGEDVVVSAIGAGTTYPDYKPAPFIVSREIEGIDCVTVVTEAIFSYCGVKVKIDTDRHFGSESATVRAEASERDVANLFERRDLISIAVLDDEDRLLGRITVDDIVDVIREQAGLTGAKMACGGGICGACTE